MNENILKVGFNHKPDYENPYIEKSRDKYEKLRRSSTNILNKSFFTPREKKMSKYKQTLFQKDCRNYDYYQNSCLSKRVIPFMEKNSGYKISKYDSI